MGQRKIIKNEIEEELVSIIVEFALEKGLTIANITEAMNKVYGYFEDNAILEKTSKKETALGVAAQEQLKIQKVISIRNGEISIYYAPIRSNPFR